MKLHRLKSVGGRALTPHLQLWGYYAFPIVKLFYLTMEWAGISLRAQRLVDPSRPSSQLEGQQEHS